MNKAQKLLIKELKKTGSIVQTLQMQTVVSQTRSSRSITRAVNIVQSNDYEISAPSVRKYKARADYQRKKSAKTSKVSVAPKIRTATSRYLSKKEISTLSKFKKYGEEFYREAVKYSEESKRFDFKNYDYSKKGRRPLSFDAKITQASLRKNGVYLTTKILRNNRLRLQGGLPMEAREGMVTEIRQLINNDHLVDTATVDSFISMLQDSSLPLDNQAYEVYRDLYATYDDPGAQTDVETNEVKPYMEQIIIYQAHFDENAMSQFIQDDPGFKILLSKTNAILMDLTRAGPIMGLTSQKPAEGLQGYYVSFNKKK